MSAESSGARTPEGRTHIMDRRRLVDRRSWVRLSQRAAPLWIGILTLLSACFADTANPSDPVGPVTQSQPPATESAPPPATAGATFTIQYSDGYSYQATVTVTSLHEEVANSPPGAKRVSLGEARATVTNTTEGRNSPTPQLQVIVAVPQPDCDSFVQCRQGFRVFQFLGMQELTGSASIASEATVEYGVIRQYADGVDSHEVAETLRTDEFFWTILVEGFDSFNVGSQAHGSPTTAAPTFTNLEFDTPSS